MRTMITRAVCAVLLTGLPLLSWAQAWPGKQPIKLVAVFPPGGSVDQVARILSGPLSQQLGQSVVVENKGGASGVIGTASVLSAPADGYTFAVVFDTHGVNQSLMASMTTWSPSPASTSASHECPRRQGRAAERAGQAQE